MTLRRGICPGHGVVPAVCLRRFAEDEEGDDDESRSSVEENETDNEEEEELGDGKEPLQERKKRKVVTMKQLAKQVRTI